MSSLTTPVDLAEVDKNRMRLKCFHTPAVQQNMSSFRPKLRILLSEGLLYRAQCL